MAAIGRSRGGGRRLVLCSLPTTPTDGSLARPFASGARRQLLQPVSGRPAGRPGCPFAPHMPAESRSRMSTQADHHHRTTPDRPPVCAQRRAIQMQISSSSTAGLLHVSRIVEYFPLEWCPSSQLSAPITLLRASALSCVHPKNLYSRPSASLQTPDNPARRARPTAVGRSATVPCRAGQTLDGRAHTVESSIKLPLCTDCAGPLNELDKSSTVSTR